jgi:hypothetical protein
MKSFKLFICLFIFVNALNAQENPLIDKPKRYEISIGMINFTEKLKLSYDYLLENNASIGTSISYTPKNYFLSDDLSSKTAYNFSLNYKHFLSKKKKHQGLYFSPILTYTKGTAYRYDYATRGFTEENSISYQALYLGMNVGYKHLFKNNLFIDSNIGISKRITNFNSFNWHNPCKIDLSISVGYRF